MTDNLKELLNSLPLVMLISGPAKLNWPYIAGIILTGSLTGVISGLASSQVMVIRLEERVASITRKANECELLLFSHITDNAEAFATIRERLATCEAFIRAKREHVSLYSK